MVHCTKMRRLFVRHVGSQEGCVFVYSVELVIEEFLAKGW